MNRNEYIGSSDAPVIAGVSPWGTPQSLWERKRGLAPSSDELDTPAQRRIKRRGTILEPAVRELCLAGLRDYAETQGEDPSKVVVVSANTRDTHPEYDFVRAETDSVITWRGEAVAAELKTVSPFARHLWGEPGTDDIPDYYLVQVQHQMMVTGLPCTVVAALIGFDDLRLHVVHSDPELQGLLLKLELLFWERVQLGYKPEPINVDDINRMYRRDSGETKEADAEALEAWRALREARELVKGYEADAEAAELKLKSIIGEASELRYQGAPLITWKAPKDSRSVDWQAIAKALGATDELIQKHTSTKPGSRRFLFKSREDIV